MQRIPNQALKLAKQCQISHWAVCQQPNHDNQYQIPLAQCLRLHLFNFSFCSMAVILEWHMLTMFAQSSKRHVIFMPKNCISKLDITMVLKMTLSCQFSKKSVVETNNNITNLKLSDGFCDAGTENAVLFAFQQHFFLLLVIYSYCLR